MNHCDDNKPSYDNTPTVECSMEELHAICRAPEEEEAVTEEISEEELTILRNACAVRR